MSKIEHRPANGGGSCARCQDSLGLASLQVGGVWYCGTACAEGRPAAASNPARVPESWLYARPRRFFRKRKPKELRSASAPSTRR
jgi:hypothetical protein